MNIAFVSNFHKTYLFDQIAKGLTEKGYNVFWFCFGEKWYNHLLSSGYKPETILLLNKNISSNSTHEPVGEYKLNELIAGDRVLRYDYDEGYDYLVALQQPFFDFVKKNDLAYIFGEMTYAHEILMARICLDKLADKTHYLHPQSIRIPNKRFTFLDTEFQDTIFGKAIDYQPEENISSMVPIKPVPPERVVQVAKDVKKSMTLQSKMKRVSRVFTEENIEKDSPSIIADRGIRYGIAVREELNKSTYKLLKTEDISFLDDKKYVFVTLHMQPEASVDVVGRYYDDQYVTIFNVWRVLPGNMYLVIKEHTNAIGNRSNKFYERCKKLKNLVIMHETTSSHTLINGAAAIFTNSGTVALEGALYGIDSFVFSRIFFSKLRKCHPLTLEDLKYCKNFDDLVKKCNEKAIAENKMDNEAYSKYILRSSFEGVVDPPVIIKDAPDHENISKVVNSFDVFLKL